MFVVWYYSVSVERALIAVSRQSVVGMHSFLFSTVRCYNRYTATLILPLQHVLALVFTRQHCAEPFRGLGCELFNHRRRGRILPATAPVAAGSDAGRQGGNRDAAGRELDGVAVSCTRGCSTARYIHLCLGAFCFRVCSCICDTICTVSHFCRVYHVLIRTCSPLLRVCVCL